MCYSFLARLHSVPYVCVPSPCRLALLHRTLDDQGRVISVVMHSFLARLHSAPYACFPSPCRLALLHRTLDDQGRVQAQGRVLQGQGCVVHPQHRLPGKQGSFSDFSKLLQYDWSECLTYNRERGNIIRVGQNHIYTAYIRYFWQGNHQIYGHIRCIYTVLANPKHKG